MKTLFLFLILGGNIAMAHPQDSDIALRLGVGTKFAVLQDINIPSGTPAYSADARWTDEADGISDPTYCFLRAKETSSYDRVISKGRELQVTNVSSAELYPGDQVVFSLSGIDGYIYCFHMRGGNLTSEIPTIGQVKSALNGTMRILLPRPIEF